MGIPSFYKRLSTVHKSLVSKYRGSTPAALYFDFNCLIYHVARGKTMPTYRYADHASWEAQLLDKISQYVVHVWKEAGTPPEVFLAVDGVVPLAKIKQQRLRRFKSSWTIEEERRRGIRESGESWDTNCITPGTAFMEKLGKSLQTLCKTKGKHWSVSTSDEPGEGEHKIMRRIRSRKPSDYSGSILVYGLDADLILLTLLNGTGAQFQNCFLMREDVEFGKQSLPGELDTFSFLSLDVLARSLWADFESLSVDQKRRRIQNYVAGMSLLGNDFLPHSLSIKVREDGHEILNRDLLQLEASGVSLLEADPQGLLQFNQTALQSLLAGWSTLEESHILQSIRKKQQMRATTNRVDAAQVLNALPLDWDVERDIVSWAKTEEGKSRISFRPGWDTHYREVWCKNVPTSVLCSQYLYGLQWIYNYYSGQAPVPNTWMFPTLLPPLWKDLHAHLQSGAPSIVPPKNQDLQPQQQLALVLPLSSWYLVRDKRLRLLPTQYPQYWPARFGLFSVGRRFLWECEPNLCFLPLSAVKL